MQRAIGSDNAAAVIKVFAVAAVCDNTARFAYQHNACCNIPKAAGNFCLLHGIQTTAGNIAKVKAGAAHGAHQHAGLQKLLPTLDGAVGAALDRNGGIG